MTDKRFSLTLIGLLGLLLLVGGFFGGFLITKNYIKSDVLVQNKVEVTDEESVTTEVVEKAAKSVVTVSINKDVVKNTGDIFAQLFGGGQQNVETEKVEQDIGTGFIISSDGLIVTNKHVVADTEASYKVVVGEETFEVINIYRDPLNDLAILKVDKIGLISVEMGDSGKLKVGQTVIAIGTALGEFRSTVTKGVISGLGRGITAGGFGTATEELKDVIQTDAAINSGNSGGPLFDSSGKVIGVNVAMSQNGQSIGFALPINLVKASVSNFRETGEFDRPYLGIGYQVISKQAALLNEVPAGAYVQTIVKDSPAEKSGLRTGDIITEIDGNKISEDDKTSIVGIINHKKIGDEIKVKYYRDGEEKEVSVVLEKQGS